MSIEVECPMCAQGVITVYRVRASGETIQVCDECESVWEADVELPAPATTTVERFLDERGLTPLWSELEPVE
jgi:uncharacterized Zn finger protein